MKVSDGAGFREFARLCIAAGMGAVAMTSAAQSVTIKDPWARATVPGQKTAGAYAELTSAANAALIAAASAAAHSVELHTMSMEGGVMRMRRVERIELPARKVVKLAPGGLHIMLIGIKQPLKPGDKVPLTLTIEMQGGGQSVHKVEAEVRGAGAAGMQHH
jgi:copper(I)-binding protein